MGHLSLPYRLEGTSNAAVKAMRRWAMGGAEQIFFSLERHDQVESVATMEGYDPVLMPQEMPGHPFLEFIHPTSRPIIQKALEEARRGGESPGHRVNLLKKDGSQTAVVCRFAADREGSVLGVAREVVQRKGEDATTQTVLKELRDFKWALDQHAIVAVTDSKGKITYVNDYFCAISKYPREELLGRDHRIINSGHHPKAFFRDLWTTIKSGHIWKGEVKNRAKDGTYYWVDTTIVPLFDASGRVEQFVAIRADITERKHAEEAQRLTQKLESLGVLAGGIAHDFNNLLTGILGNCNLVSLTLSPEDPAQHFLARIEQGALRAAALTRQMLTYAGKGKSVITPVDMNSLVREMTNLLAISISKKATIRLDLAPELPLITADASQMQQVVMNLVTNASDALENCASGTITIQTTDRVIDVHDITALMPLTPIKPGRYICLDVSDNGCGMSAETVRKIFDPFFTTKFTGRGLGLSALLGILKSHGGTIKVYSEVGQGTSMKVFLPVADNLQMEIPPDVVEEGGAPLQGTVLVVDDDPDARNVAHSFATRLGLKVLEAIDGRDAVRMFALHQREIDLVLLDVTMPNMDGREAFTEIRKISSWVPVILSSGYNEIEALGELEAQDLAGFLPKPYQHHQFEAAVRRVVARR